MTTMGTLLTPTITHTNVPAASHTIETTSLNIRMRPTASRTPSPSSIPTSDSAYTASSSSNASSSSTTKLDPSSSQTLSVGGQADDLTADYVLAMHDYAADRTNATCLSFKAGQVIRVYNRDGSGWWDGELEGRRGWFPSNYVSEDVTAFRDEVSPTKVGKRRRHARLASTASVMSTVSWGTSQSTNSGNSSIEDIAEESFYETEDEAYTPPIMVPLLHALSLLQGTVQANRIGHFQASTACILSCVRTILSAVDCLDRDAPVLRQLPIMGKARKSLFRELAGLVSQAKKASTPIDHDETRLQEMDGLLRRAGRVFANVRRFLALADECGLEFPPARGAAAIMTRPTPTAMQRAYSHQPRGASEPDGEPSHRGRVQARPPEEPHKDTGAVTRIRSMGNLHARQETLSVESHPLPPPTHRSRSSIGHRQNQASIASQASASSSHSSSTESTASNSTAETPPTPPFPSGPSSPSEVMDVLRHTHNQYLSTIAAFVGQSHSHSRSSHATSAGHMYDLARDIVEMVCKMLTVVDAVSQNPALTQHKLGPLNNAKDALYTVTRAFAESVRMLTHPATMSEEEERAALQRAATNALKAGAECVSAIKLALTRMPRQQALHVQSPERGAMMHLSPLDAKRTALTPVPTIVTNSSALNALYASQGVDDDQDLTIQAQTPAGTPMPPRLLGRTLSPLSPLSPTPNDLRAPSAFLQTPTESIGKPLPPIRPRVSLEERPQSPTLSTRTDDGTTWEGSLRGHSPTTTLEQKLMDGDLPAVPEGEMTAEGLAQNWMVSNDYAVDDVAYNSEGHLVGATLPALVEKLTPHDGLTDSGFATVFFTTFRLFATPQELLEAIIARYNILPPPGLPEEYLPEWQHGKGLRVRLRVANLLKTWLDAHWRVSTDAAVLPSIYSFTRDAIAGMWPGPAQQLLALVASRQQSTSDAPLSPRLIALPPPPSAGEMPRPIITKTLFAALRSHSWSTITVADFDTLELARQFTVLEYGLFVAIGADEVLDMGERDGAGGGRSPPSVRAVTGFSTAVTGWVSECVLNEPDTKKRMGLVKYFIKLADRCSSLNNFATSRSILAALDSSTILHLHDTWGLLPQKHKTILEGLRKLADHSRNYYEYRTRLRNATPPAVPFLGLYLTDLTFCREGNPSHRASPSNPNKKLLNFNKYHKLARIVQDMERFHVPYNLKAIPEVHEYLHASFEHAKTKNDLHDLYRRSRLLEPKRPADATPTDGRALFPWISRTNSANPAAGTA